MVFHTGRKVTEHATAADLRSVRMRAVRIRYVAPASLKHAQSLPAAAIWYCLYGCLEADVALVIKALPWIIIRLGCNNHYDGTGAWAADSTGGGVPERSETQPTMPSSAQHTRCHHDTGLVSTPHVDLWA